MPLDPQLEAYFAGIQAPPQPKRLDPQLDAYFRKEHANNQRAAPPPVVVQQPDGHVRLELHEHANRPCELWLVRALVRRRTGVFGRCLSVRGGRRHARDECEQDEKEDKSGAATLHWGLPSRLGRTV